MAVEILDGPMAGSKVVNIYTTKGAETQVDAYEEFSSMAIPPVQLEGAVLGTLEQSFNEDSPAIKAMASKK